MSSSDSASVIGHSGSLVTEQPRPCTCHPREAPKPCQRRYALGDCQKAAWIATKDPGAVAWRVKDFADGWFYYGRDQWIEADRAEHDGFLVEPLYLADHASPSDAQSVRPDGGEG